MAKTLFTLLAHNGYSPQDHPEPEAWIKPVVHAGIKHLEYCADHMDPCYYENVILDRSEFLQATRDVLRSNGVQVVCVSTGRLFYLTNGISHPFADARRGALRYCERMTDLAVALGARVISGHFDYISRTEIARAEKKALNRLLENLLRLAEFCAARKIEGIYLEQMYTPSLKPYTIVEAKKMMRWLNQRAAVPYYLQIDTGHMALAPPEYEDHTDADKDPYQWLATRFPGADRVWVHLNQTDRTHTRHWPFTPRYNRRGIISPERVIQSVEKSGVREAYLSFETLYPRGTPLAQITENMRGSAQRFRKAFAALGYTEHNGVFAK